MVVRIRLSRFGCKNRPFYRVMAADSRSKRDGRHLEVLGYYNPLPGMPYPCPKVQSFVMNFPFHDKFRCLLKRYMFLLRLTLFVFIWILFLAYLPCTKTSFLKFLSFGFVC